MPYPNFEAALLLAVPDLLKGIAQQKLLANKQDLAEREAKKWLDKGNLLKAKLAYDDAFKLDTTNTALKKQIADLQLTIGSEKETTKHCRQLAKKTTIRNRQRLFV